MSRRPPIEPVARASLPGDRINRGGSASRLRPAPPDRPLSPPPPSSPPSFSPPPENARCGSFADRKRLEAEADLRGHGCSTSDLGYSKIRATLYGTVLVAIDIDQHLLGRQIQLRFLVAVLSALMSFGHGLELRGGQVVRGIGGLDDVDHVGHEVAAWRGLGRPGLLSWAGAWASCVGPGHEG